MTPLSGGADDLPPLPEPSGHATVLWAEGAGAVREEIIVHGLIPYSASAMQAYARQAIESDRARRQGALTAFHHFFADRCEALFGNFGMEAIELYNAAALSLKGAKD